MMFSIVLDGFENYIKDGIRGNVGYDFEGVVGNNRLGGGLEMSMILGRGEIGEMKELWVRMQLILKMGLRLNLDVDLG